MRSAWYALLRCPYHSLHSPYAVPFLFLVYLHAYIQNAYKSPGASILLPTHRHHVSRYSTSKLHRAKRITAVKDKIHLRWSLTCIEVARSALLGINVTAGSLAISQASFRYLLLDQLLVTHDVDSNWSCPIINSFDRTPRLDTGGGVRSSLMDVRTVQLTGGAFRGAIMMRRQPQTPVTPGSPVSSMASPSVGSPPVHITRIFRWSFLSVNAMLAHISVKIPDIRICHEVYQAYIRVFACYPRHSQMSWLLVSYTIPNTLDLYANTYRVCAILLPQKCAVYYLWRGTTISSRWYPNLVLCINFTQRITTVPSLAVQVVYFHEHSEFWWPHFLLCSQFGVSSG